MLAAIASLPTDVCPEHDSATSIGRFGNVRVFACDTCGREYRQGIVTTYRVAHRVFPERRTVVEILENGIVIGTV